MQTLFIICFGVGIGYTLIGFVLGEVLGVFNFEINGLATPFKPPVIAAFLTVFGGVGIILINRMFGIQALMTAGLAGLFVAYLFGRFVLAPLYQAQNTSSFEIQSLIGYQAKVTEKIFQGGYGKITYYVNGNTYSSPAKSEDGNEISRNTDVEIVHIEKNVYYVRRKV